MGREGCGGGNWKGGCWERGLNFLGRSFGVYGMPKAIMWLT